MFHRRFPYRSISDYYLRQAYAKAKIKKVIDDEKYKLADNGKEIIKRKFKNWKITYDDPTIRKIIKYYKYKDNKTKSEKTSKNSRSSNNMRSVSDKKSSAKVNSTTTNDATTSNDTDSLETIQKIKSQMEDMFVCAESCD